MKQLHILFLLGALIGSNPIVLVHAEDPSQTAKVLWLVANVDEDEETGGLDDFISDEVNSNENLKIEYPTMGKLSVYAAKAGFFVLELYAKIVSRLRKIVAGIKGNRLTPNRVTL